jgi:hypothetical protein
MPLDSPGRGTGRAHRRTSNEASSVHSPVRVAHAPEGLVAVARAGQDRP